MEKAANPNDDARRTGSTIIPSFRWVPYAVAACLMILGISQTLQVIDLKSQLLAVRADATRLRESNALMGLHLATIEAKDTSYGPAKIIIAWDPYQYRGVVAIQNLPAPPAGHDYQLWVLDPAAEAPISAGLITGFPAVHGEACNHTKPRVCGFAGAERRQPRTDRPHSFCCRTGAMIG